MTLIEASEFMIGASKVRIGGLGPISGHLELRLVLLVTGMEAKEPKLEALGLRFWALKPKVGALGSRFEALRPRIGALGQKSGALGSRLGLWNHDMRLCDQD